MAWKKKITHKTLVWTAVIGSLLIMAMVSANTLWVSRQTSAATDEAVSVVSSFYLEAMADRRAKIITNLINNNFDEMDKAISFIESEDIDSQTELRYAIGRVKSLLGLNRFALVDKNNIVYTQYTTYTGGSRHTFLSEGKLKGRTISIVSLYGSSKQMCLAIPTPGLTIMGKSIKACFVQLDISEIIEILAFDDQGKTSFALYSKNGVNLSGTKLGSIISTHNLFDAIKGLVSDEVWRETRENFAKEKDGSITLIAEGVEEILCYVPVEGTGWEMAVLIRESVIQSQIRDISNRNLVTSRNQIIFTLVAMLLLAGIILFQIRVLAMNELEEEKEASRVFRDMANTDSLTGVQNKYAYSNQEAILDQRIQAGEIEKLAVVVGDINGLKYVNDTQGHAAGDQLIQDACDLICEYFEHDAVFRVGGDEFVIILQGKDCDALTDIVDALNHRVRGNIKENAVVISVGYAVLEQEDKQLRDVFERADQMMYEQKKALKSIGAQTSRV